MQYSGDSQGHALAEVYLSLPRKVKAITRKNIIVTRKLRIGLAFFSNCI
jgi:hypothetical protein